MNRHDFINKFNLSLLNLAHDTSHLSSITRPIKEAAVLITLVEIDQQLEVILTRRAAHLKHHPGQISFPGGKVEPQDKNIVSTALRESEEEIGLMPQQVEVIGKLNDYNTVSGFKVTPVIAMLKNQQDFTIDTNEVSEVFNVPLKFFIDTENHSFINLIKEGKKHKVYFMPYEQYNIWGTTALILKDLVKHLT